MSVQVPFWVILICFGCACYFLYPIIGLWSVPLIVVWFIRPMWMPAVIKWLRTP